MRVSFERTGGFAGIPMTTTVDASTLTPAEATQLRTLVEAASFFALPPTIPSAAHPDRFQYQITVEEGDRQHTVAFGETAMPGTLRPLVERLMELARRG